MEKACKECGAVKELGEFYRHAAMKDGHLNTCKDCYRAAVRLNRIAKAEHYRDYDRARYYASGCRGKPSSEAAKRGKARWAAVNRHKRSAHSAVRRAVLSGRLHKPDRCERCHKTPPPRKLHAHHHDYSRPLDVEWICSTCHGLEHRLPGWEKLLPAS